MLVGRIISRRRLPSRKVTAVPSPSAGQVAPKGLDDAGHDVLTRSNPTIYKVDGLLPKTLSHYANYQANLIYPGLYAPSGFDMMSILVSCTVIIFRVFLSSCSVLNA